MTNHLPAVRLAATDPTSEEQEHLRACARCRAEALRVRAFIDSGDAEGAAPGSEVYPDAPADTEPPPERLAPGTRLGRYVIEGTLGEGGMAVVYRARHTGLGVEHAIKVLTVPSRQVRERLLTEGRVQASIHAPNIVPVTDIIDVFGAPGLVMELVEGPSLAEFLQTRGRLPLAEVDELARGILAGAAAAHRAGLIHRDLKPGNILLARTPEGLVPKITDFGLAKVLDPVAGASLTRSSATLGTPRYMSPEQIRAANAVDQRSDVFSLGAILYELVTGTPAFDGADLLALYRAITEGRYRPIRELVPETPDRMVDAITAALQVDRELRPADVDQLAAMWRGRPDDVVARRDPRPPVDSAQPPPAGPLWRRPWVIAAGLVVLLGGPAILVAFGTRGESGGEEAHDVTPGLCPLQGSLMPLRLGNWWEYRMVDPESGRPQQKNKRITLDQYADVGGLKSGTSAFRLIRSDALGSSVRWISREGDGIVWHHDAWLAADGTPTRSVFYVPSRIRVDEACEHLVNHATWTESFDEVKVDPATGATESTRHNNATWTVESLHDEVKVPAGTFDAVRIRRVGEDEDQTFWFTQGVGKVKESSPPKEYEELVAYEVK